MSKRPPETPPEGASGEVVDLGLVRARSREPDVRLVLELWRTGDGRVAYNGYVEELQADGEPGLPVAWLREHLRWALLEYAKGWRMGLRRRARGKRRRKGERKRERKREKEQGRAARPEGQRPERPISVG